MNAHTGIGGISVRKEDRRFITGKGNYVADIKRPDMAMGVFRRSRHRTRSSRPSTSRRLAHVPGVAAMFLLHHGSRLLRRDACAVVSRRHAATPGIVAAALMSMA